MCTSFTTFEQYKKFAFVWVFGLSQTDDVAKRAIQNEKIPTNIKPKIKI